jgi:hypothetical protein
MAGNLRFGANKLFLAICMVAMIPQLILLTLYCRSVASDPLINVEVVADWRTSRLAEAGEFYHQKDPTLFWDFLDQVDCEMDQIRLIEQFNRQMVNKGRLNIHDTELLDMALSIRYYSPLVQAYQNIGEGILSRTVQKLELEELNLDSENVLFVVNGTLFGVDGRPEFWEFGHGRQSDNATVHLFGELGDCRFHSIRKALISRSHGAVHKFYHFSATKADIRLSGYGVELIYKSTEYNTTNDFEKTVGKSQDFGRQFLSDGDLTEDFAAFKSSLGPVKDGNMTLLDHGIRAIQWIFSQPNKLNSFRSIVQNIPLYYNLLPLLKKDPFFRSDDFVEMNSVFKGLSLIEINGFIFESSLSVFKLLDWLIHWANHYSVLEKHGIDPESGKALLNAISEDSEDGVVVDIRSSSTIYFLRNEPDKYKVADFIICFSPINMIQIGIVLHFINAFSSAKGFNLGVNFIKDVRNDSDEKLHVVVIRAIYHLNRVFGAKMVLSFLKTVAQVTPPNLGKTLSFEVVDLVLAYLRVSDQIRNQIYNNAAPLEEDRIVIQESERIEHVLSGIKVISFFINGQLVECPKGDIESLLLHINRIYHSQMKWFSEQQSMLDKHVPENWYSHFLNHRNVYAKVNPLLLETQHLPIGVITELKSFLLDQIQLKLPILELPEEIYESIWISTRFDKESTLFIKELLAMFNGEKRNLNVYLIVGGSNSKKFSQVLMFGREIGLSENMDEKTLDRISQEHRRFLRLINAEDEDILIVNGKLIKSKNLYQHVSAVEIKRLVGFKNGNRLLSKTVLQNSKANYWISRERVLTFLNMIKLSLVDTTR